MCCYVCSVTYICKVWGMDVCIMDVCIMYVLCMSLRVGVMDHPQKAPTIGFLIFWKFPLKISKVKNPGVRMHALDLSKCNYTYPIPTTHPLPPHLSFLFLISTYQLTSTGETEFGSRKKKEVAGREFSVHPNSPQAKSALVETQTHDRQPAA